MTQDEIIEMARPAKWLGCYTGWTFNSYQQLEAFAKLVAEHEREACAKVVERLWDTPTNGMATEEQSYGDECAKVIRARGQA